MTPEGKVKLYLKNECESRGWFCLPLENRHMKKWPDRTILIPHELPICSECTHKRLIRPLSAFIEVKDLGTHHSKGHIDGQRRILESLIEMGFFAAFAVGRPGVDKVLGMIEWNIAHGGSYYDRMTGASTLYDI